MILYSCETINAVETCTIHTDTQQFIFLIEFVLLFYVFYTLMNYSSGFVSRLIK